MSDLSITIVAYNNKEDVEKAVCSIENCTPSYVTKKIYIVDNSDKPLDLSDLSNRYIDVSILATGKNLGFGAGHNYIINKLDSKYHAIVNPDIELKEDSFGKIMKFMDDTGYDAVIPRLMGLDGKLQAAYRREITITDMFLRMFVKKGFEGRKAYHTMQDMDYSKPFQVPFAQGSFIVIRTELFKRLKGFDDRFFMYMEDADLCKRINKESAVYYYPGTEVIHRWEKGSHKNRKLLRIHISSMCKYFLKWGIRF